MILVTGITGYTGRYFLKELEKNDYTEKIRFFIRKNVLNVALENKVRRIIKVLRMNETRVFNYEKASKDFWI